MSLIAPLFLGGLLAIGLPLWLHRLSSENPNRQPFSSLMFLEAGEPHRILAKNLQYLLLLALRIALLVLLALAFAQPAWWRSPEAAAGASAELHVIAIDASASMAFEDRFARAQDEAAAIIDGLDAEDLGQVLLAGRTVELLTGETLDRADLRQAVRAAEPGPFHLDFGQLTRALDGVVRAADLPIVTHIVTDAQETGLPTRFAELAPRQAMRLAIHDVGGADADNWALDVLAGSAVTGELAAGVQSFAGQPADKTLRLELNGRVVDEQRVTIEGGGRAEVTFAPLNLEQGANRVSIRLMPGDGLEGDDTRFIALKRSEPRPVLVVSGDPRGRDILFVESAMESLSQLALSVTRATPADLGDRTFSDYEFVVVADVGALGAGNLEGLTDYVESGGAALIALGPRSTGLTVVPVTGQTFAATNVGLRGRGYAAVGSFDASHPALRGIGSLRAARYFRHAAVEPAPGDTVLASLDDGAPLLLERAVGGGRVLLYTSSLDREWNDIAVQPVFVPLLAGLSNHLLGGAGFSSEADLGGTLALRAMGMQGGQIFDPGGSAALGLGGTNDVLLDQIGFYELVGGGRSELVAVNFDARESNLASISADTLGRWQDLGKGVEEADVVAEARLGESAEVPVPLGPWILLLLIVVFVVESSVGNWHLRVRRGVAA